MVVKFTATSRPTASDVSRSPLPPSIHRWYANPLRMLDPTIMKQSRAHTRGSTLQNGIRQDAGASEMASATAVFSLGQIGITQRPLCYSTTLTSPLFPAQPSFPIVRLRISTTKAAEPFQCDIASVPTTRADSLWRWTRALRAPQDRNRRNEGTRALRKAN